MPNKSIREMTQWEVFRNSLEAKVFHMVLLGSVLLGTVALMIGLGMYSYSLTMQYIGEAFSLSRSTATIVEKVVDMEKMADDIMSIYRNMSVEERKMTGTAEYRKKFADIVRNGDYQLMLNLLNEFRNASDVNDVFYAYYDEETQALIYFCDPDPISETGFQPGEWQSVEMSEITRFHTWDGQGRLYDISNESKYGFICTAGVPVRNSYGEIIGFILADVTLSDVLVGMKYFIVNYTIALIVTILLMGWMMSRRMRKMLVTPVNAIAEAAKTFVTDRQNGETKADHFSSLNIRTGDEIENLAIVMGNMETALNEYEERLTQIVSERERIGTELELAKNIQSDMLPSVFPAFPERSEFDIYAAMDPAKMVGGDFYDFFLIDDDHLAFLIADVSDKGIPAALFMMASKIILGNNAMMLKSPKAVLENTNKVICMSNREQMFVTVWLGILEISTGIVTAANAGHEYPAFKKPDGEFELLRDKHGLVIGGMEDAVYSEYRIQMEPGAKLFVYTDGVPEAAGPDGSRFGVERMLTALNSDPNEPPKEILENVRQAVDAFEAGETKFDDLTMLCLEYCGRHDVSKRRIEQKFPAKISEIPKATEFIRDQLEQVGCGKKEMTQINIAIDEILSNIANYAYDSDGEMTVRFHYDPETDRAGITFLDNGKPFNPLEEAEPDTTLSAEDRQIGGMGIFLVRKTMDEVTYKYKDGRNVLRIEKTINSKK